MSPTQRGGTFGIKNVKLMYFLKNPILYSGAWSIQTMCIVMINKKRSTKTVNFMTLATEILGQVRGKIKCSIYFKFIFSTSSLEQTNQVYSFDDQGLVYQNY